MGVAALKQGLSIEEFQTKHNEALARGQRQAPNLRKLFGLVVVGFVIYKKIFK
jgi:hypothetical protein